MRSLTATLGSALVAATVDAMIGFAIIFISSLMKIRREEEVLEREFGEEYRAYRNEVAGLVPYLRV